MTPEQQIATLITEVQELRRLVDSLRKVEDVQFSESLRKRSLQDVIFSAPVDTVLTDLIQAVDEGGVGTYNVAKVPTKRIPIIIDGTTHYLGGY